ncbi:hypothetical protein F5148DRAFT_1150114 [Russula earlei]|uniref:Uncharacterized protein n=1 Tax=Russula earlei TaxID=71964 RepID=A0ACC0U708_9AGAM|nr:hypothetical protein F5148DRAFT_1150114 [Russula earlei]
MLSLPLPLLLLIHIHLLGYPHADEPEYDEHVFNVKTRGLRDRTKTMEDLCYFLVGKIEHKPRLQSPSDSVAFRTVFAKYLEGLRNHVVRPETLSKFQSASSKGKKSPASGTTPDPWWWKDVVVRRSLLDECTGNRFERMIIALSTHALFANTSESLNVIASDASTALSLLPTLPRAHVSLEARIRCARGAWERSAALLQQRQADLKQPESMATAGRGAGSNVMLAALSLGELVSLCESKRELLPPEGWQGEVGRLKWPQTHSERIDDSISSSEKISTGMKQNEDLLPPLPTAAAHHPQHMELFSSSVMQTSSVTTDRRPSQTSDCDQTRDSTTRRVHVLITERLAAEEQTAIAFEEALNRMHTMREGLQAQLEFIPPADDDASARAQSRNPSDASIPPAPSKVVTAETLTREQATRPLASNPAARTRKATTVHSAIFPLPKTSRPRNQPSRPRTAAVSTGGSTQPIRPLKLGNAKHGLNGSARPAEPPPTSFVPKSSGAESSEAVAQKPCGDHQSSCEARLITTTTQERKAMIIKFDEDEAFLPSELKPNIKPPAPPKYDFIEDNSAFLPSFLKRDMVQMDPVRPRARLASASLGSSRESTPERGISTRYMSDGKGEDDWSYEGRSMTLRDILVRAGDATFAHFDILHEEDVNVADETLGWE